MKLLQLFGEDPSLKYVVTANVILQVVACYLLRGLVSSVQRSIFERIRQKKIFPEILCVKVHAYGHSYLPLILLKPQLRDLV